MRYMAWVLLVLMGGIGGCASTKIAKFGKDTYIVNVGDPWSYSPSGTSVEAARQANLFCEEQGKVLRVRNTKNALEFSGAASSMIFSCINETDAENTRPEMRKDPSAVVQIKE